MHFAGGHLDAELPDLKDDYSIELWFWNGMPSEMRSVTGTLVTLGTEKDAPRLVISGSDDDVPGRLTWIAGRENRDVRSSGTTRIHPRAWHHAVLVNQASRIRVFLNGNQEPEIDIAAEQDDAGRPLSRLLIAGGPGNADSFEGRVDEVAVYARPLSIDEIRQHFEIADVPLPEPLPLPQPPSTLTSKPRTKEYGEAVLRSKPVVYWPLYDSEGDSKTKDVSENGRHAVFEQDAGPLTSADQSPFHGGRLTAQLERLGQTWSVELWFRNSLPNTNRPVTAYLVSRGPAGDRQAPGDHFGVGGTHTAPGRLFFFNGNRLNQVVVGVTEIPPDTWNHVVLVRDQKHVRIYLNGRADPEAEGEAAIPPEGASADFFIGGRNDNFANLQGAIKDVSVYDRVLTPEEMTAHFAAMGTDKRSE